MMPSAAPSLSYFSMNSIAPDSAIEPMYFFTSSASMPMPLSRTVMVRAFLLTETSMRPAVSMSLTSPSEIRRCSLTIASEALETISRRKISLSEYSQRLMTGKIFLVSTEMPPFSFIICSDMKISFL